MAISALEKLSNTTPPLIESRKIRKFISFRIITNHIKITQADRENPFEAINKASEDISNLDALTVRIGRICDASDTQLKILRGVLKRAKAEKREFALWMAAETEAKAREEFDALSRKLPPDFILERGGKLFLGDEVHKKLKLAE